MSILIKILVADDHTIFRAGLASLLKKVPRINQIKQASNGKEVISILEEEPVDIILMDIGMPKLNGIETTKFISNQYPEVKVIALSMHNDHNNIMDMIGAGAVGYLLKNTDINELKKAIYAVLKGEKYFSQEVSELILEKAMKGGNGKIVQKDVDPLTEKDIELIKLICKGLSAHAIAKVLGVSDKSIEGYKSKLFQKTGVKNTTSLVLYAVRHNIVEG